MEADIHYALITGAANETGYGLADLLAKDGFNMVIVAGDDEGLSNIAGELKQQYGIKVITISKDLFLSKNDLDVNGEVIATDIKIDLFVMVRGRIHIVSLLKPVFKRDYRLLN